MPTGEVTPRDVEARPQSKSRAAADRAEIIQLIVFYLGDEEFGARIDQVREIIRAGKITPIPDSPRFIKGVANVRGEIVAVIDLKERFFLRGREKDESKHIVLTEQEGNLFGLMVDEVTEVLRIPETEIKHTPGLVTKIDRVYIRGVITYEDRLIMLLDLAMVLSEKELIRLAEVTVRHRAEKEQGPKENEEKVEAPAEEKRPKTKNVKREE